MQEVSTPPLMSRDVGELVDRSGRDGGGAVR